MCCFTINCNPSLARILLTTKSWKLVSTSNGWLAEQWQPSAGEGRGDKILKSLLPPGVNAAVQPVHQPQPHDLHLPGQCLCGHGHWPGDGAAVWGAQHASREAFARQSGPCQDAADYQVQKGIMIKTCSIWYFHVCEMSGNEMETYFPFDFLTMIIINICFLITLKFSDGCLIHICIYFINIKT